MTANVESSSKGHGGATNPYVGPRAMRRDEAFFARDREKRDLANLLVAERIVLLHAPSGAGKTSLIQAGLIPLLEKQFRPTVAARVKTPPPKGVEVYNRYIYSVAMDWLDGDRDPSEFAEITFADIVRELETAPDGRPVLLILDQFEEILSIDPTDWKNQTVFFQELGNVLRDGRVWALISMREDYMGGLDRFLRYVPGHLQTTFRLDYLSRDAAKVAIQQPARDSGVEFADDAATELVNRLARVVVARPNEEVKEVDAPYVQPFHLQVVCRRLWEEMRQKHGDDFTAIELKDIQDRARIPEAMAGYYASAVAAVAREEGVEERALRDWFEHRLITKDRLRTQVLAGPETGSVDTDAVLDALEETRLIRKDIRGDSTWWEISHDTLIRAILDNNRKWYRGHLQPWQRMAHAWAENPERSPLLTGPNLRSALQAAQTTYLNEDERKFLKESERGEKESERVEKDRGALNLLRNSVANLRFVVIVESVAIVGLVILLIVR